jgi:hypothetical protein
MGSLALTGAFALLSGGTGAVTTLAKLAFILTHIKSAAVDVLLKEVKASVNEVYSNAKITGKLLAILLAL